jgi:predicted RNA binding protein YcfA (HicA-like mRNA interferase family)
MSRRLPTLSPRKVIQALERGGFFVDHVTGSHYRLKHRGDPTRFTVVPFHSRDIKRPVLRGILKQAGLSEEEFLDLL